MTSLQRNDLKFYLMGYVNESEPEHRDPAEYPDEETVDSVLNNLELLLEHTDAFMGEETLRCASSLALRGVALDERDEVIDGMVGILRSS